MPRRRRIRTGLKKLVKSMINNNTETKTGIQTFASTTVTSAGTNYPIPELAAGVKQNERVGNQIRMTSLRIKGIFNQTGSHVYDVVRCVVYIPKDPDDLLNVDTTMAIDQDKFTVLSDRLVPLSAAADPVKLFNKVLLFNKGKRNGMRVQFSSDLATSCTKNNIKMYLVSMHPVNQPTFSGYWRFYFKDA